MPTTIPNANPAWQQATEFIAQCVIMAYQRQQQEYIRTVLENLLYATPSPRLESGMDAQLSMEEDSMEEERKRAQSFIDSTFEYFASHLFVTSVLASGELVGSTIWGISKYVSKDIIWNTLGATAAAVILQSADLVGYRNEVQKLFGIKNPERRATLAIKIGGIGGKAVGSVAGSALSVYAELALGGVFVPTLIPWVVGIGFFIGQLIGELVGVAIAAAINNLFFSTIGAVPASYRGIKQKGSKFVDRIKHSREVKRSSRAQNANNPPVPVEVPVASASPSVVGGKAEGLKQNVPNSAPIPQDSSKVGNSKSSTVVPPKNKVPTGVRTDYPNVRLAIGLKPKVKNQPKKRDEKPLKTIIVAGNQNAQLTHAQKPHNKKGGTQIPTGNGMRVN